MLDSEYGILGQKGNTMTTKRFQRRSFLKGVIGTAITANVIGPQKSSSAYAAATTQDKNVKHPIRLG